MIEVYPKPAKYNGLTIEQQFIETKAKTPKEKIKATIELVKSLPIDGCITGSIWLDKYDPVCWGDTKPDIDVFVFSESDLMAAINIAMYALKMTPGTGTPRSQQQEEWKIEMFRNSGLNYKIGVTTYKFFYDGIILNFTYKQKKHQGKWIPLTTTSEVLASFDMSIVMQGYDIKNHVFYDLRTGDPNVAYPNPLRDHNCVMWTVSKWIRQFDRVVKYYNRGYDTRPMARFYLKMIDECIEAGCLFDSEESQAAFASFSEEFLKKRADIADWLEAHEED